MADVRIHIGHKYEVLSDERRAATEALVDQLRASGVDVELEVVEYEPGRRGLTLIEWTAIFIGTNVATDIISNLTRDVYEATRKMLRARRQAKGDRGSTGRSLGFVIYRPDGEELRRWNTGEDADQADADE